MDLEGKPRYQVLATAPNFCKNFGTIYIFTVLLLSIMFHSKSSGNIKKKPTNVSKCYWILTKQSGSPLSSISWVRKLEIWNLLEFERPEIFVDEKRANGVGKNWAEHLQVLRFYPTLKMTAAWWEFSIFLTNLFFSLHVTLSYQVPRKFSRLCQAGGCCPHRPSAQPWRAPSALWFSCTSKKTDFCPLD